MIDRNRFRIGWELETMKVNGTTRGGILTRISSDTPLTARQIEEVEGEYKRLLNYIFQDSQVLSSGNWMNDLARAICDTCPEDHVMWKAIKKEKPLLANHFCDYLRRYGSKVATMMWLASDCPKDGEGINPSFLAIIRQGARDNTVGTGIVKFESSATMEWLQATGVGTYHIETDGTVTGLEFKPEGPLDPDASLASYGKLYAALSSLSGGIEVNEGCSFHVHVSVADMQHFYGRNMQAYMYKYVLDNIARVPMNVLKRWAHSSTSDNRDKFFKMALGGSPSSGNEERYSFIAFRHQFKTWEFRCWGNITTPEEAKVCVDLSLEAYNYAFELVHKQRKLADTVCIQDFANNIQELATSYTMYNEVG